MKSLRRITTNFAAFPVHMASRIPTGERSASQKFKQNTTTREPQIGDVVLIEESNVKKKNWRLGIIYQLQRSQDGRIRSAVLRLSTGTKIIRPLESLYDLEFSANDAEPNGEPERRKKVST